MIDFGFLKEDLWAFGVVFVCGRYLIKKGSWKLNMKYFLKRKPLQNRDQEHSEKWLKGKKSCAYKPQNDD